MRHPGTSLTELALALTILGVVCTLAAPAGSRSLDALRTRTAREQAYGFAMRTRALAIERGGADLIFDLPDASITMLDGAGTVIESAYLGGDHVTITTDPSSVSRLQLRYDARGIGRMASRTITFRKGSAQAGLTFSSYGRVRRW